MRRRAFGEEASLWLLPFAGGTSLGSRARRASVWTAGGFAAEHVLRLVSNLILTRLLFPDAFGLMSLVWAFVNGLQMMSDTGIVQNILCSDREDAEFLCTAWTVQVLRGFLLWFACVAIAGPLADLYDAPLLASVLPVAGLTIVISALASMRLLVLNRELAVGRQTVLELASQVVALIGMVVWALLLPSVWVLVGGALINSAVSTLLTHVAVPGFRHRLRWEPSAIRELLAFGKWVFMTTAVAFFASQSDRLLLGRMISVGELGVYSVACVLSEAGVRFVSRLSQRVLLPAFGQIARRDRAALYRVYQSARRHVDLVVLPTAGLLMTSGGWVVPFLYDARYEAAGWMLQLLAARIGLGAMIPAAGVCLVAIGDLRWNFASNVARALWLFLGIPFGWYVAAMPGAVAAVALGDVVRIPFLWSGLRRYGLLQVRWEISRLWLVAAGAASGWLLVQALSTP